MTKEETIKIMAILKAAYPNYCRDQSKEDALVSVEIWHKCLTEYEYITIAAAVKTLIKTLKFAPTIADVIEEANNINAIKQNKYLESMTRKNLLIQSENPNNNYYKEENDERIQSV